MTDDELKNSYIKGRNSVFEDLENEFVHQTHPREDILYRALDDYFSGCTHYCADDEEIEMMIHHVINYYIREKRNK